MGKDAPGIRYSECERETKETRVRVVLDLDGGTRRDVATGIAFFDHMLKELAFHGQFDIGVIAEGDLEVDDHHLVEDVGIVLGQALGEALKSEQVRRYASNHTPVDDALILAAVDISGRGQLYFNVPFEREKLGGLSTECVREFYLAVAHHSGITIHLTKIAGQNDHHLCEATFRAFGRAIHEATRTAERHGAMSTKGLRD